MERVYNVIDGKLISYTQNQEKGIPVFLIHGNSAGYEVFFEQLNNAMFNKYRLIALDLPGCGDSYRTKEKEKEYAMPSLTTTLKKFIASFNFETYAAIGHSLGGHLLLEAADNLIGLQKLILFGTPPLGNTGTNLPPFCNNTCIPLLFKSNLTELEQKLLADNFIIPTSNHFTLIQQLLAKADGQLREQLGIDAAAGKLTDEVQVFKNLKCEKYVLHGENDGLINFDYLQLVKEFCSDKKIHLIHKATHYPQLENTIEFNTIVLELLKS